jgi:hypothetical protein
MIERRDMLKILAVGVVGAVVVGGMTPGARPGRAEAGEAMRFSVEGDMGAVRATSTVDTIHISGHFAEPAVFVLR